MPPRNSSRLLPCFALLLFFSDPNTSSAQAPSPPAQRPAAIDQATLESWLIPPRASLRRDAWGVTRRGTPLTSWLAAEASLPPAPSDQRTIGRILVVGGLDGRPASVRAVRAIMQADAHASPTAPRTAFRFAFAIPCGNPDGLVTGPAPGNAAGGDPELAFPPRGAAYHSPTDPEAAYLWRWIGMHAPDLVLEVAASNGARPVSAAPDKPTWKIAESSHNRYTADLQSALQCVAQRLDARAAPPSSLVAALAQAAPCETGFIPALRLELPDADDASVASSAANAIAALLVALDGAAFPPVSPARREWQRRQQETPLSIAEQLAQIYGRELPKAEYIPAMAMVGRWQLAQFQGATGSIQTDSVLADLERIAAPFLDGRQDPAPKSGSGQSGHLIFAALADAATGERRAAYIAKVKAAADQMFDEQGRMRDALPFHSEMSDAAFMGGPILAAAGRLTDDSKYFDASVRQIRFIQKLDLRPDGLYRHSPLDESAWGRGNGFPALGLALVLTDLPADHPDRAELVAAHRAHLTALQRHQDVTGAWHQVIDHPESYRELTATCMITFAMHRGVRLGWLDRTQFSPSIERGWAAIRSRIGPDGRLVDVCTGTGKMKSLREYYDREALLGRDPRGGAMALLVAVELLQKSP